MSNLVVVAIPEEMDRVWKLSSEKVPHLTLLFLGEADNNPHVNDIVQFVEHAVTLSEHGPFYLDIDHRGTLGPDDADVLFFSKRSWNLKWIKQFRGQLLQNENVRSAYDFTPQYEEWQPHLTMGYPTTPAKEMGENDHPLYSVCFDRIAVWDTDYDGPEFRLEWPDRELDGPLAVAYSDTQKAALTHYEMNGLEHHGVKGMKWGARKAAENAGFVSRRARNAAILADVGSKAVKKVQSRKTETVTVGGKSKQVTPKKAGKLDKQWQKNIYSVPGAIAVHNGMAAHFNERIGAVNDKYKNDDFSKTDWNNPKTPREKSYAKETDSLAVAGLRQAVKDVHGNSPTGKLRAELSADGDHVLIHENKLEHAATDPTVVAALKITRNSAGLITKLEPLVTEDPVKQTAAHGREFVEALIHGSVLDNPTLAEQIKAKIQSILDDVSSGGKDVDLFGDPLIQTKIRSVLEDFYKDPNVDNQVVYSALGEALSHYGIKGMRWGIRKEAPSAAAPHASSHVPAGTRRKTQVKVSGGENHPASQDAIKVAESHAKLRKSGMNALSNKELQDLQTRLNLEKNVSQLVGSKSRVGKGREFVRSLTRGGKELNDTVNTGFQTARLAKAAR